MTPRKAALSEVLLAATLIGVVIAGVVILRVLAGALAQAGVGEAEAERIRGAVAAAGLVLVVAAFVVAALVGRFVNRSLYRLRARLLDGARADEPRRLLFWELHEVAAVSAAAERMAAHVAEREAELQRDAAEIAVLLDAISEGILQLGAGGRIVRANPRARAMLRLSHDSIGQVVATQIRNVELRSILDRAAAGEPVQNAELTMDGRRLLVSARPLAGTADLSGEGAVVGFVDLTEVRRLEGVRRDFVANVSHELKTPLTSIRGYAETLLSDDLPPDMQRQFLEVVHKNADRLHHIVEDLLDLSRLESGGWRSNLADVDALDMVQDVWSGCVDRATRRSITFQPPAAAHSVRADPGGLRQVLSNLLDNALRYTPEGGDIQVVTRLETVDASNGAAPGSGQQLVVFEVRDSGSGIPSDALPRIFERFYRVDTARSRSDGGTGLGLSIVKHLVESMGGDVMAESEFGKGTVIRFRLPASA
jgi:two-component system, OmpR family, phosphate regulon sensor histidine kinase PhoR